MGRPYPQDRVDRLRRLTETYGIEQAAEIARVSSNGIRAMRRRGWSAGGPGRAARPMPSDFLIQAAHMTVPEMIAHYRAGALTVKRWCDAIGRPKRTGVKPMPIPEGVAGIVSAMGADAAARHFGVADDTMRKWRVALGLPLRAPRPARPRT
jgi:hypothetical protein